MTVKFFHRSWDRILIKAYSGLLKYFDRNKEHFDHDFLKFLKPKQQSKTYTPPQRSTVDQLHAALFKANPIHVMFFQIN